MTAEELWSKVGEALLTQRHRLQLKPIDVERRNGPSYKTVQVIERGQIASVQSLTRHADALGLNIVDVMKSILDAGTNPLTPEAAQVARKFSQTTVEGRTAMLAMANALPEAPPAADAAPPAPGQSPLAPPGATRRRSR